MTTAAPPLEAAGHERTPLLDPRLPGLPEALLASPGSRIRSVEWVPRRRCRVVREVRTAQRGTELLAHDLTPSGARVRTPVGDRDLPGLPVVLDPDRVRDRLVPFHGGTVGACRVTPVSWRPGSRAVVAYAIGDAPAGPRYYAKVLAGGAARYAEAASAIAAAARGRGEPAPVPRVVGLWRDLDAVVQDAAPGRPLSTVLRDPSVPAPERLRCVGSLGRSLAGLHATPAGGLPRWTPEDELVALQALLPATSHADPAAGRALADLVDRLADTAPAVADPALSHGAFRTGQVVLDGTRLTILDLDTVGAADPSRDVGNALAYLSWADVRAVLAPGFADALSGALVTGYGSRTTPPGGPALAWWSAAAMGKIAGRRYRALATPEWPSVPALLDRAAALLAPRVRAAPPARRPPQGTASPADVLDPDRMTQVLREQAARDGTGGLRVVAARPLAEAPGRRRVVRYLVAGLDGDAAVPVIGKLYASRHRAWIAHENLRLLGDEVFVGTPGLAVPAPVGHVPGLRLVLYREVPGTSLDELAADAAADAAGAAAVWLRTLHGSGAVLTRRQDLSHEVADVRSWARAVTERVPGAAVAATALADRLGVLAPLVPAVAEVPVHKDFHAGHVLVLARARAGGPGPRVGVAVIDLDEARMGDPALDLASATTYLDLSTWTGAAAARERLLAGYGPLPGPSADLRLAFFAAVTCMKIAKQLVGERGPLRAPRGPSRVPVLAAVLRKGLACLDA